jgi:Uma2 family endonuclease
VRGPEARVTPKKWTVDELQASCWPWIIELSDTSLLHDREKKLGRYARVGIREVWIVNLNAGYTEVYRDPHGEEYLTN